MRPNGDGEVVEEKQASSARSAIRRSGAGRQSRRNAPLGSVLAHVLLLLLLLLMMMMMIRRRGSYGYN